MCLWPAPPWTGGRWSWSPRIGRLSEAGTPLGNQGLSKDAAHRGTIPSSTSKLGVLSSIRKIHQTDKVKTNNNPAQFLKWYKFE